jgi:hypothetical protein
MEASRMSRTTEPPESPISSKEPAGLWIELTSTVESISDKSDHQTVSINASLSDEKQDYYVSHDRESARPSKGSASIIELDIEYPSTHRVLFVTVCLAIAVFLVGLDRTIVATAT